MTERLSTSKCHAPFNTLSDDPGFWCTKDENHDGDHGAIEGGYQFEWSDDDA